MNLSPDSPAVLALETLHRPPHQSSDTGSKLLPKSTEVQDTTAFYRLLDTPEITDISAETLFVELAAHTLPLNPAPEETLETSIEASAWLALNSATETMPTIEPVSAPAFATQTTVCALNTHDVLTNSVASSDEVLSTQTLISLETLPQATAQAIENTPVAATSHTPIAEILASNMLPMTLNPTSFLLSESGTVPSALPAPNAHHSDFAQGIATHLTWLTNQSIGQAYIQINPPHLGAVDIRLHLHDQQLRAAFFSPHNEVCQRLEESLPVLHRLLDEQGLHLAHAEVNQQTPHSQTDAGAAKTPVLAVVDEHNSHPDTTQDNKPLASQLYSQTTLLDTWA